MSRNTQDSSAHDGKTASEWKALYEETEHQLRIHLFCTHNHAGKYGEDGEMQCGKCLVDFKRDSLDKLLTANCAASVELMQGGKTACEWKTEAERLGGELENEHAEYLKVTTIAREIAEALDCLYNETAEYITINFLGDVHQNNSMKESREALARAKDAGVLE